MGDGWNPDGWIFTELDGHVMNPQTPTKQFDHFLKRHGIRHLKFHGLRHTSATMLIPYMLLRSLARTRIDRSFPFHVG